MTILHAACRSSGNTNLLLINISQQTRDGEEFVNNKVGWRCIWQNNEIHVLVVVSFHCQQKKPLYPNSLPHDLQHDIVILTCVLVPPFCIQALIFGENSGAFMSCTYTSTCAYTCTCTCIGTCTYTCTCAYTYTCTCIGTCTYTCTCIGTCTYTCTCAYTYTCIFSCIGTCTCIFSCTCTCTYTCTCIGTCT